MHPNEAANPQLEICGGCIRSVGGHEIIRMHTLEELVAQIAAGNESALTHLYDLTVARVFAIAQATLHSKEDAEEVVCDVYAHVWERAATFDAARGRVMAWLSVVARHRAIDRFRQRRATISIDDERNQSLVDTLIETAPGPDQLLSLVQSGTAVHCALQTLSPERRYLLGLAFFRGLTHDEIAQTVGMPLGTVKSHLRRALATMQTTLRAEA